MKVVLKKDVPKLGNKFQVVEVSDGYARNFLLPMGLAEPATPSLLKEIEKRQQMEQQKEQRDLDRAQRLAHRLSNIVLDIKVPAGESGRLYHSVSAQEIVARLKERHMIELDRDQIDLDEPIRTLGVHSVPVKLHRQVRTTLQVNIVAIPA